MSRIAIARNLANELDTLVSELTALEYAEIRKVYSVSFGLADAVKMGMVTAITDFGVETIADAVRALGEMLANRERHRAYQTVEVGDVFEIGDWTGGRRERVTITSRDRDRSPTMFVNSARANGSYLALELFWNARNAVKVS